MQSSCSERSGSSIWLSAHLWIPQPPLSKLWGAMLRLAVVLLGMMVGWGSELCLNDGVPESQREYIQEQGVG